MEIILIRRKTPLKYGGAIVALLSLGIGILLFTLFTTGLGISPGLILYKILSVFVFPGIIRDFIILTLLGYALVVAFRGSVWNIGAEGQMHMAFLATLVITTIVFFTLEKTVPWYQSLGVIILSIVLATLAGALWAGLAGLIKAYANVDEVPVTLVLNYIAYYIGNILVYGPFRGKYVYGYARTDMIPDPYRLDFPPVQLYHENPVLNTLFGYIRELSIFRIWVLGLILVAVFTYWLFNKTTLGLRIKILGSNPDYLVTLGYDVKKTTIVTFMISGAIVGFTAALYYHGSLLRLEYPLEYQTALYGYLAILVAWLSNLDLRFVPVSAYIVSALIMGSTTIGSLEEVRRIFTAIGLGGGEIALRFLMFGSILLAYSILRFVQDYTIVVRK